MTHMDVLQIAVYFLVLIALIKPIGWYIACVYKGENCGTHIVFRPVERFIYRCCFINVAEEMDWRRYLFAVLIFNLLGFLVLYFLQRIQSYLPLNPQSLPSVPPVLSFNTAVSFVTNTNWESYSGETTMSYLTQMLGFTVQNFLSAASGMAILIAFIRGLIRNESNTLGNFWVDMTRSVLYILLPISFILAIILCSQGVIQNFKPNLKIDLLQQGASHMEQIIPMGPVASQIAIKQLGTNGGGFFNANSAHPFENPNPLTNFLEMLAILLIPAALAYTFGLMVGDKKQARALLITWFIVLISFATLSLFVEKKGNPAINSLLTSESNRSSSIGNLEGKETRFGIVNSALWSTITSASSNGSVNSMLDSYTPLGGLVPLILMHFNGVIFGGVGSGLYSMLLLVIIAVFITGLMVGRTPEYLGKKIEPFDMKMVALTLLMKPFLILLLTAIASVFFSDSRYLSNPGPHGFSEIFYAFTSMAENNGSAFSGLKSNTIFYNVAGGFAMLISRYWIAIPVLALAGSLVRKKKIPQSSGTLQTDTPLFIMFLIGVLIVLGMLSFLPALILGPIIEQLMLWRHYGY